VDLIVTIVRHGNTFDAGQPSLAKRAPFCVHARNKHPELWTVAALAHFPFGSSGPIES